MGIRQQACLLSLACLSFLLLNCNGEGEKECESIEDCRVAYGDNYVCDPSDWKCKCFPDCTDKCCGDDGCGGNCPDNCVDDLWCDNDTCRCYKECCQYDENCLMGECCRDCECVRMACGDLECGPDPVCGKECGPCSEGYNCINGYCIEDPCVFCKLGYTCQYGICKPAVSLPGNCIETDDCPPGYYCENHVCYECPYDSQREDCEWRGEYGIIGYPCPTESGVNIQGKECDPCLTCSGGYELGDCVDASDCLLPEGYNPECLLGKCGYSFCSRSCEDVDCPPGFVPDVSLGECYCFPES